MPDYKKVRAIENFETIAHNISILQKEVLSEHEILFWKTLENIETRILANKKKSLVESTHAQMQALKSIM